MHAQLSRLPQHLLFDARLNHALIVHAQFVAHRHIVQRQLKRLESTVQEDVVDATTRLLQVMLNAQTYVVDAFGRVRLAVGFARLLNLNLIFLSQLELFK